MWIGFILGFGVVLKGAAGALFRHRYFSGTGQVLVGAGVLVGATHGLTGVTNTLGLTVTTVGAVVLLAESARQERLRRRRNP